jgi:malonyl-CoA O-methyltransferase
MVDSVERYRLKNRIAAHFGLKVSQYARYAVIQRQLHSKIIPLIFQQGNPEELWIDLGCGSGELEKRLHRKHFPAEVIGIDIAYSSLEYCLAHTPGSNRLICADIEHIPLQPSSCNGIIAASVLQWSENLSIAIKNLSRLLKPKGIFIFAIYTDTSFIELVTMQKQYNLSIPVTLPDRENVLSLFSLCNLTLLHSDSFSKTLYFPSAHHLLQHLSSIGSTIVDSPTLTRGELKQFCLDFENTYATERGVPLTYNALYGTTRKGETDG